MDKEIRDVKGTHLTIVAFWTDEETPQLREICLHNGLGESLDIEPQDLERLISALRLWRGEMLMQKGILKRRTHLEKGDV